MRKLSWVVTLAVLVLPTVTLEAGAASSKTCGGKKATIVGANGSDIIDGTGGSDVIWAGGGDDRVKGRSGDDTICGNAGKDVLRGGGGKDKLIGGGGNDTCKGGPGKDKLVSCEGDDGGNCHPSYPDFCIPPPPPDKDCDDVNGSNFTVVGSDPHGFDGDNDGIGCET